MNMHQNEVIYSCMYSSMLNIVYVLYVMSRMKNELRPHLGNPIQYCSFCFKGTRIWCFCKWWLFRTHVYCIYHYNSHTLLYYQTTICKTILWNVTRNQRFIPLNKEFAFKCKISVKYDKESTILAKSKMANTFSFLKHIN